MATRTIIRIDEALCNGCGACVTACAEGALKLVNGKARLVKEQFCDGFGDCLGPCPTGALTLEKREADGYDPSATRQHLEQTAPSEAVRRFDQAAVAHARGEHLPAAAPAARPAAGPGHRPGGGCPGTRLRMGGSAARAPAAAAEGSAARHAIASDLQQWPVQLHLVPPDAPFFRNRELAVLSTCAPVASADAHWRWIRGRSVVVGCPKLDDTTDYAGKLGAILREPTIPKVLIVRMTVPCCGGLTRIVLDAVRQSGRKDLAVEEVTVGLDGDVVPSEGPAK